MRWSRVVWVICIFIGVVFSYLLGIFVRGQYGIAIAVRNLSGETLQDITVKVEPQGLAYPLGVLSNERHTRAFVQPRTESHVVLQYADGAGTQRLTVVGYAEAGYCGKAEVIILPEHKFKANENLDPVFCRKSWLDFM